MTADPRALARRFALLTGLRWFPIGLVVPISVLLMQARGLDLATIGGIYAVYGIVTVVLELPTGGLADVVGRRVVLVVAAIATAASLAIAAVSHDVAMFTLGMVIGAVGRALGSGPLDAWYVDAVHAIDPHASVRTGLARAQSAESLALGVGAIAGGLLPIAAALIWPGLPTAGDALIVTLSIPSLIAAAMMAGYAVLVGTMVDEAPRARVGAADVVRGIPATVAAGMRLGVGDAILRRLLVRAVLLGVVLSGVELLAPGTFAGLLGGQERASGAYGLLTAAAFAGSAAGATFAPRLAERLGGSGRTAALMSWLAAPAAWALAFPFLVAAGLGYVAIYLLLGVVGPLTSELLHGRVRSTERATMVSVESLALQAGGVISNLVLGSLVVATSTAVGFGVIGLALVGSGVLLLGIREPAIRTAAVAVR